MTWCSKRQSVVALSSMEAEYISMSMAAQEVIYMRGLLEDMAVVQEQATTMFVDSQSAMNAAQNAIVSQRSKHIDIRYHYIREVIEDDQLRLVYVSTQDMVADVLTKPVSREVLQRHISVLQSNQDGRH